MNKNIYKIFSNINSFDELENVKNTFLIECEKHHDKLTVNNLVESINNITDAQSIFESIIPSLMSKKDGKKYINGYINILKENESLKTIYSLYEGLKRSNDSDSKKIFITEALSLSKPIDIKEYDKGIEKIKCFFKETFEMLGSKIVLNTIKIDNDSKLIGESLCYLSTTKKNIKNLNEYFKHINIVSNVLNEEINNNIDVNLTLNDIVKNINENSQITDISDLLTSNDKLSTFTNLKENCLKMLKEYKTVATDNDVILKLTEMEIKLNEKQYNYQSFTKDILYMCELNEILK